MILWFNTSLALQNVFSADIRHGDNVHPWAQELCSDVDHGLIIMWLARPDSPSHALPAKGLKSCFCCAAAATQLSNMCIPFPLQPSHSEICPSLFLFFCIYSCYKNREGKLKHRSSPLSCHYRARNHCHCTGLPPCHGRSSASWRFAISFNFSNPDQYKIPWWFHIWVSVWMIVRSLNCFTPSLFPSQAVQTWSIQHCQGGRGRP